MASINLPLKISLLRSGRTQLAVAKSAGLSPSRLSMIVRGWTEPRPDEKRAISKALGFPVDLIFPAPQKAKSTPEGGSQCAAG